MEPDQPLQKGRLIRWILILSIGCISGWISLALVSSSEAARSPEQLYRSGKTCQDRLHSSSRLQRHRTNWESCIKDFDTLLTRYPKNRFAEESLFSLGELYGGLYRSSKDRRDGEKSREYYREVIADYPDGLYAKTAQRRLKTIDRILPRISLSTVQNIRSWAYPDYTRLVLDMDGEVQFRQGSSDSKEISITLDRTRLSPKAQTELPLIGNGLLQQVNVRQADADSVILMIGLNGLSQPPKILPLSNPDRLVIDLFGKTAAENSSASRDSEAPASKSSNGSPAFAQAVPFDIKTIVIDPGHGGKDPGAIGRAGLTEKDVVLDIGLRLRSLIRERLGKTVVMTREDDTFIPLDDRTLIANSKNADLFVSIHANSHPQRSTRGVEIYHLGQSSDRHAMAVAARENNVSMKSLDSLDRSVKQILFDLGRNYNIDQSQELAHHTRQSFRSVLEKRYDFAVVDHGVKSAPFYVLLNSNMPSILAEVSFISNPVEEQLLRQSQYRQAVAESLFEGIRNYLAAFKTTS